MGLVQQEWNMVDSLPVMKEVSWVSEVAALPGTVSVNPSSTMAGVFIIVLVNRMISDTTAMSEGIGSVAEIDGRIHEWV